ncbi:MAD-domain-containing protein [Meredithblackwellia eburnea MCA 4105]
MSSGRSNDSFETPLLGSRTLISANNTVGSLSRLPRSANPDYNGSNTGTMTAGRPRILATSSSSRLPTRSNSASLEPIARPSSSSSTLKRTSSIAGLGSGDRGDSELTTTKRALSSAQHSLSELQYSSTRQSHEQTTLIQSLQSQLEEYVKRTERLELQRTVSAGRERENEERESKARLENEKTRMELESQASKLRLELSEVRGAFLELGGKFRDLEHEAGQNELRAKAEERRARGLEEELEGVRRGLTELREERDVEREARRSAEKEREELRRVERDDQNSSVVREELHRQVSHLRSLEKENSKLLRKLETYEKQHTNLEILKESNKALEKKVRGLDAMRTRTVALEAECELLKKEKMEWQSFLEPTDTASHGETSTPRKLSKTLAASRIESASLRDRLEEHQFEVQRRDRIIGEQEERIAALEKECEETRARLGKSLAKAGMEEQREELFKREIEMLKRHLATFSTEEAINNPSMTISSELISRITELEQLLEAHKQEVAKLVKEVSHYQGLVERYGGNTTEILDLEDRMGGKGGDETKAIVSQSLQEELRKNEQLLTEIDELRNTTSLMEKEIESLELQVDRLTYEHGNGAYDPRTTKVLELRDNPDTEEHAVRTATLERLKDENEALLSTLALLEMKKGGFEGGKESLVPRQSLENAKKEVEAAEATIKQKEIMETRLKKAFADKADEFRKAVQSLLGFRLDFLSSGRVKVTSVYNPGKEYALLFGSSSGGVGTMELMGGASEKDELGKEVQDMVKYWVTEQGSVPGLLASLSLTLFDKSRTT